MNTRIGLQELSVAMASITGRGQDECEQFVRTLFSVITESLAQGESVKVKGLGTFKCIVVKARKSVNIHNGEENLIPSHKRATFTPDKAMADAVNAPFAMFEPVEIDPSLDDNAFTTVTAQEVREESESIADAPLNEETDEAFYENPTVDLIEKGNLSESTVNTEPTITKTREATDESDFTEPQTESSFEEIADRPVTEPRPSVVDDEPISDGASSHSSSETDVPDPTATDMFSETCYVDRKGYGFWWGVLAGVLFIGVLGVAWRYVCPKSFSATLETLDPLAKNMPVSRDTLSVQVISMPPAVATDTLGIAPIDDETSAESAVEKADAEVPTEVSDSEVRKDEPKVNPKPKYIKDKITKQRFLTTMAREYYGNYNLWPLIYDANPGLGHPDRIRPGTSITVPTAETLGINLTDSDVIAKAKKRGASIYDKYRGE